MKIYLYTKPLITSIWKLRAVKLPILSRYVLPGITVCIKGEHFDVTNISAQAWKLGAIESSFSMNQK